MEENRLEYRGSKANNPVAFTGDDFFWNVLLVSYARQHESGFDQYFTRYQFPAKVPHSRRVCGAISRAARVLSWQPPLTALFVDR